MRGKNGWYGMGLGDWKYFVYMPEIKKKYSQMTSCML